MIVFNKENNTINYTFEINTDEVDNLMSQPSILANLDKKNLYTFKEVQSIMDSLNIQITKRTIAYYIEEQLLPELIKKEKKKQLYYSYSHICQYAFISMIRDYLTIKEMKIALMDINKNNDESLLTIIEIGQNLCSALPSTYESVINQIFEDLDENEDNNLLPNEKRIIILTILTSYIKSAQTYIKESFNI